MEFAQVTRGVLFCLPIRHVVRLTKPTLVLVSDLLDEPVVHLLGLETARKVHRNDLVGLEGAMESSYAQPVLECSKNPIGGKILASAFPANFLVELDRVV